MNGIFLTISTSLGSFLLIHERGALAVNWLNGSQRIYLSPLAISLVALIGCVPMHTVTRPTLDDVRLGINGYPPLAGLQSTSTIAPIVSDR
jgi:hypothetical protein